jgi:beta-1,4-mannosyl-glycoprotein beta-1,4-N-acetylglucosaminyltransferase
MYYDENVVLDIRLNYLDKFVDKFVIVESQYAHNGEKRKLLFNINNFKKFSKKIIYIILRKEPDNLIKINKNDFSDSNPIKVLNAVKRENFQRNFILKGLKSAEKNDIIIISDIDEIPKLDKFNFKIVSNKIYFFEQKYFYYKLNLFDPKKTWYGSRLCRFDKLLSPQWLRNLKTKNYPLWRLDLIFNKKKYFNNIFIKDGGWHFSYLKKPIDIKKKLKTYLHHVEYELNPISVKRIGTIIKNKKAIYDLNLDQRINNRFSTGSKLKKFKFNQLPDYIKKNKVRFKKWLLWK